MTDQDRISREQLVKRAALAAGAIYAVPVLASSAGAAVNQRCRGKCAGDKKCQARGGKGCCCRDGRCTTDCGGGACGNDCAGGQPCDVAIPCGDAGECSCFVNDTDRTHDCVVRTDFCDQGAPCVRGGDNDCAAGTCCYDTCCPEGICIAPCGTSSSAVPSRYGVGGARTTL